MFLSLCAAVTTFLVPLPLLLLLSFGMTAQLPMKSLFWLRTRQVQGNSPGLASPCWRPRAGAGKFLVQHCFPEFTTLSLQPYPHFRTGQQSVLGQCKTDRKRSGRQRDRSSKPFGQEGKCSGPERWCSHWVGSRSSAQGRPWPSGSSWQPPPSKASPLDRSIRCQQGHSHSRCHGQGGRHTARSGERSSTG